MRSKILIAALVATSLSIPFSPARAGDLGCTFFLCMAGSGASHWKNISECRKPVKKALRKMIRGWVPHCTMVSGGGSASGDGSYFRIRHERYLSCSEAYAPAYRDAYFNRSNQLVYGQSTGFLMGTAKCAAQTSSFTYARNTRDRPADTGNYCTSSNNSGGGGAGRGQFFTTGTVTRTCHDVRPRIEHESPDFVDIYIDGAFYTRTYWTEGDAATDDEVALDDTEE